MGQYFDAVVIREYDNGDKKVSLYNAIDHYSGQKLMEFAYIGNVFADNVCRIAAMDRWWDWVSWKKDVKKPVGVRMAFVGDYAVMDDVADMDDDARKAVAKRIGRRSYKRELLPAAYPLEIDYKYAYNEDKKEMVCLTGQEKDSWGYRINPLVLMLAVGNGRGGGDYEGTDMQLIGRWAFDHIKVEKDYKEGYKDMEPIFDEGGKYEIHHSYDPQDEDNDTPEEE